MPLMPKASFMTLKLNQKCYDPEAESKMEIVTGIISGVRNVRGEMNIAPSLSLDVLIQSSDEIIRETVRQHEDMILNLA